MRKVYQGSCHCKSIKYSYSGDPLTSFACHCTDCQAATGGALSLNLIIRLDDLELISGELLTCTYSHNDQTLDCHCCKNCYTALWLKFDRDSEWGTLLTGTLQHEGRFDPIAHIWTRSAVSWIRTGLIGKCYDTQPEFDELVNLWQTQERD